ncbi:uncharacterized protein [Drosophila takahashii]|uniref:uncharacterized protein isoform X4 n=1 Tax=Drosophila takahashii TaxID=29030 RepID=UPI0038993D21
MPVPMIQGSAVPASSPERILGPRLQLLHLHPIRIFLRLRKHGLAHSGFIAGTKTRLLPVRGASTSSEVSFDLDALVPQLVHRDGFFRREASCCITWT